MSRIKFMKFDDDDDNNIEQRSLNIKATNSENNLPIKQYKKPNGNKKGAVKNVAPKNAKPNPKNVKKPKKRKNKMKTFFTSFIITIFVLLALLGGVFLAYDKILYNDDSNIDTYNNDNSKYSKEDDILKGAKNQYNFAIFGTDNESEINSRTDFMMIGSFDRVNNKLKLMSIPRDTLAYMPSDRIEDLKDNGVPILFPSSGRMKMTEINHFATDEYGTSFLLAQLEEDFQIDFDFYVKFDLDGFKFLVDEIGGVPFYVPQRMYYNDPTQDLYVDLQEGYQTLNGEQAEGVVRYRKADAVNPISKGYPMGDIDRIKVQQDFIKAFVEKLTTIKNLGNTLPAVLKTASKYAETNFKLTELPIFLPFITNYNDGDIIFYTMPYDFQNVAGVEYVVPKEPDTSEVIDEIFYPLENESEKVSSKGLDISVLNGTYTSGLATEKAKLLEENGFSVSYIGDYNGEKIETTKIYVKERSYGDDLKKYFNSPKIIHDEMLNSDIEIVLGTNETL